MPRNTTAEIAGSNWTFSTDDTQFSYQQIHVAAALETLKAVKRTNELLEQIRGRIDQLGSDGLHFILQDERAKRHRVERLKRARAAKKRAATIARKKAAAATREG